MFVKRFRYSIVQSSAMVDATTVFFINYETLGIMYSQAASSCAASIHEAFGAYLARFDEITQAAQQRFLSRDWLGLRADTTQRLDLYPNIINHTESVIQKRLRSSIQDKRVWAMVKTIYAQSLKTCQNQELAKTFFNSVTRRIFHTVGIDPRIEFVGTDFDVPAVSSPPADCPCRTYQVQNDPDQALQRVISDYGLKISEPHPQEVVCRIREILTARIDAMPLSPENLRLEMLAPVFYRQQSAFLIGRLTNGIQVCPVVLALLHPPGGIEIDAFLVDEASVSILFSFTRSAFHVKIKRFQPMVDFLKSILPSKPSAEICSALGHYNHGKTEFYRDWIRYTAQCQPDRFQITPGVPGMVMIVFDMPNRNLVVKLIRDHFRNPKTTTRQGVIAQYDFVFKHARVGRLIEAQSFEHLSLDRCCFSDDLLDELLREASQTVRLENGQVDIAHAYVERRVTPLDLYLKTADAQAAEAAVIDLGHAIKDLASSNIFPGDMLLKNFGVTRHGRVVFYDYDELSPLTDCNFRSLPEPRSDLDEMASEPWFFVGENDVFPEEFVNFMGLSSRLKQVYIAHHGDLFTPQFWKSAQKAIRAGQMPYILPYHAKHRLRPDPPL